jgi:hypothetical protein
MCKRIISFDVGIKNLAYCLFSVDEVTNVIDIERWDVANLIVETPPQCSACQQAGKTKKGVWTKNAVLYCNAHGNKSAWAVPSQPWVQLNKLKNTQLQELADTVCPQRPPMPRKAEVLAYLTAHREDTYLDPVCLPKAKDVDIVVLGRALVDRLDKALHGMSIDTVLVENQIGTIALRMKTLQGMLYQYFIMRHPSCQVVTVSSSNKLKLQSTDDGPVTSTSYSERKKQSILLARTILPLLLPEAHSDWLGVLNRSKKKDDLADSLLQGLWFLKERMGIAHAALGNPED